MEKNEVKVGQCYMAKVTGSEVPVRIETENRHAGWDAKNVATGRKVRIKSAQRLRRKCTEADLAGLERPTPRRRKKASAKANTSPRAATGAKSAKKATTKAIRGKGRTTGSRAATGGSLPATSSQSGPMIHRQRPTGAGSRKDAEAPTVRRDSRISSLTAALMVLVDANAELDVKAIVEIAAKKGWWKSDAATPAATVYAAIIREIATKGDESRFERGAKRGTFRAICTPARKQELFTKKA